MKKIIALLLVILIAFAVTACGADSDTSISDIDKNSSVDTGNEKKKSSGALTVKDVMSAPVSAESDFTGCKDDEGNGGISLYSGTDEVVVVPETIDGETITFVRQYCFSNRTTDKAIRFPDTIEYFEDCACALNENIEIVIMGKGTKSIGEGAFLQCKSLKEVVLNEGLESIDTLAFVNCDSLKSIHIPESVTTIEYGAFPSDLEFTIFGKAGSFLEQYAQENSIKFVAE